MSVNGKIRYICIFQCSRWQIWDWPGPKLLILQVLFNPSNRPYLGVTSLLLTLYKLFPDSRFFKGSIKLLKQEFLSKVRRIFCWISWNPYSVLRWQHLNVLGSCKNLHVSQLRAITYWISVCDSIIFFLINCRYDIWQVFCKYFVDI